MVKEPIDLNKIKDHAVTMPLLWIGVIFMAGWLGRPAIITYLESDFFTQAQAQEHTHNIDQKLEQLQRNQTASQKVMNDHITEFRAASAFQLVRGLEADLQRHQATPNTGHTWVTQENHLKDQVKLAHDYKDCLVNNKPNCHLIQKQIFK